MLSEQRLLFRQGLVFLLAGAVLGVITSLPGVPNPVKWRAAHMTALLTGVLLIAFGSVWPHLRLTDARRRLALKLGLTSSWTGLASSSYIALANIPEPATNPGAPPGSPLKMIPFFVLLTTIVVTLFGSFFLIWRGLQGDVDRPA